MTDGSLRFAVDYLQMDAASAARFYAHAPVGMYTWVAKFSSELFDGVNRCLFCCRSTTGGIYRGLSYYANNSLKRTGGVNYWGGAMVGGQFFSSNTGPFISAGINETAACVRPVPYGIHDSVNTAFSWTAGAYNPVQYDIATMPRLGIRADVVADYWQGRIYYLALIGTKDLPGFTPPLHELRRLTQMLADGHKPWCEDPL